ncbi:TetR/AcrR family transcriptional regulator [Tenggerimyces flavus]|uniref:TetR/AcrR family transcriptional regulator n=1 Tax=Tenggerimyces flavus TaxID=1708749 RepID=A0ABV7YNL6_9ACTN|nr:TetR/AcrR family transcriptional regulator [Tenggerimyces flavus]MBM7789364.1 AcrR family transcriptional regulator [Tenggerimyces flavus]
MSAAEQPPRRRQARGERRIEQLLRAAAEVFAEVGYEAATTNAIAARAGTSPGTLYQFFPNKLAMAEALAGQYVERLKASHAIAMSPDLIKLPLRELLDKVVDTIIAANVNNPGFKSLFADSALPHQLTSPGRDLHAAVAGRIEELFALRVPDQPVEERARAAQVTVALFQGMVPLVVAASEPERPVVIGELKKVLYGYLSPILGER